MVLSTLHAHLGVTGVCVPSRVTVVCVATGSSQNTLLLLLHYYDTHTTRVLVRFDVKSEHNTVLIVSC